VSVIFVCCSYASAYPVDEARGSMFSIFPSVCACVRPGDRVCLLWWMEFSTGLPSTYSFSTLIVSIINLTTHTHIRLTALFPGPGWPGTRKVKPIWILLKQETVNGSGISWAICKSATRSRQITTPAPHHSVILQAGSLSCHPTNSVKALKACTQQLQ